MEASPRKMLRFQALKSAFWWILEMASLWIMEKAKKPRSNKGVWTTPTLRLDLPLFKTKINDLLGNDCRKFFYAILCDERRLSDFTLAPNMSYWLLLLAVLLILRNFYCWVLYMCSLLHSRYSACYATLSSHVTSEKMVA